MTKSKGVGRGGKRSNPGGRPRKKPAGTPSEMAKEIVAEIGAILDSQPDPSLDDLLKTAYRTLDAVMKSTAFEAGPRVSAARAVFAEAARKGGSAAGGKKGERAEAAKAAASGKFAVPSAPRLVVDNK